MTYYLRKIDKAKWEHNRDWLQPNELQSDVFNNLKTSSNSLSLFCIEDDFSNLDRVIAALAANADEISKFDYVLVEDVFLNHGGFIHKKADGETPDDVVNKDWHCNLLQLTTKKMLILTKIFDEHGKFERILPKVLEEQIKRNMSNGNIDVTRMKPDFFN